MSIEICAMFRGPNVIFTCIERWLFDLANTMIVPVCSQIFTKKLKYIEDYKLIDGRLVICAIAVGTAMFALLWDYLYPFPLSR